MARRLRAKAEVWPLAAPFRIARGAKAAAETVVVEIEQDGACGRGEAVPYRRYRQTVASSLAEIEGVRAAIEAGAGRDELATLLGPSAARNALDCALWHLEARLAGVPVWQLAGLERPRPLTTAYTLSLDTPEAMGRAAAAHAHRPLLKVKLDARLVRERLAAVAAAAPTSHLVVDANEAWSAALLAELGDDLAAAGVVMVEQPLPAGADAALAASACPAILCADESCHTGADVAALADRYGMVNVKLDKTGGLTEALALIRAARAAGLPVMVGSMVATSLAMAPAMLAAQGAAIVDLDGPLLLQRDRTPAIAYRNSIMHPPARELWG